MKFSEVKEVMAILEREVEDFDIRDFFDWAEQDKEVMAEGWTRESKTEFPFDLADMVDSYLRENDLKTYSTQEIDYFGIDENAMLLREYYNSVL